MTKSALWFAGIDAYGWSRMARSETTYAYFLYMYNQAVNPSFQFSRYIAFPLLSYVRSGYINLLYSALRYAGIDSLIQSLFAGPEKTNIYFFYMNDPTVSTYNISNRYLAFPVRTSS